MCQQAWNLVALAFVALVLQTGSSPFNRQIKSEGNFLIEIDCSDFNEVERLEKNGIPYHCTEGSKKYVEIILQPQTPIREIIRISDQFSGQRNSMQDFSKKISNRIDICSGSKNCEETICGKQFTYAQSLNLCVPKDSDWHFVPSPIQENKKNICKSGYSYHKGLNKCLPKGHHYFGIISLPDSFLPTYTTTSCDRNSLYVAEIEQCVPKAILMTPNPVSPSKDDMSCPKGFAYSPEVDLCLPYTRPSRQPQEHSSSVVMMQDQPHKFSFEDSDELVGKEMCKSNEFYLSELDICVPDPEYVREMQNDAPVAKLATTESPKRITFSPAGPGQVGKDMCKKGMVYVSEIDHCVEDPNKP